jgi:hypothetical protein
MTHSQNSLPHLKQKKLDTAKNPNHKPLKQPLRMP